MNNADIEKIELHNETITEIKLHELTMGDVEDPYLYAAEPLYKWEKSEQGQWVMAHATEPPVFYCGPDLVGLGFVVSVWGKLRSQDLTYYTLRWGH
jgi:hypothetical protein